MAKRKETNLSIAQIKKEDAKKYKETVRVEFENGAKVDVDVYFRPSKISDAVKELVEITAKQYEETNEAITEGYSELITTLMLKHFTSLEFPQENSIPDLLQSLKFLIDNHYYAPIMQKFNPDEITNYYKEVSEKIKVLNELLESRGYEDTQDLITKVEGD